MTYVRHALARPCPNAFVMKSKKYDIEPLISTFPVINARFSYPTIPNGGLAVMVYSFLLDSIQGNTDNHLLT